MTQNVLNKEEKAYLDLMKEILDNGEYKKDRTGIGTKSLFGTQLKFDISGDKIPLLTTKKVFIRGIIEELIFFINGKTQTKELSDKGVRIWEGNTSREFLDNRGLYHYEVGEMGPMYGSLWRDFNGVDQLADVLDQIKTNPDSRRMLITAYDPSKIKDSVLAPCHILYQFYVGRNGLSCQYTQRSVDFCAGLPFNIVSATILTRLLAKASGIKTDKLIMSGGDTHIYSSHIENANEQLNRIPFEFPTLDIVKNISNISDMETLQYSDFKLNNYNHHPSIKYEMAI